MSKYVKVQFLLEDGPGRLILNFMLGENGVESIEELPEKVIAYFKSEDWKRVEVAFAEYDYEASFVVEENWNAVWEASFEPVNINDFCYVRAPFHKACESDELIEIILEPKMAFGTAHHETTFMMMAEMQEIDFEEKEVFDFGCGTAILSILAEKLGSSDIYAIDIEENAIENAHYNCEINKCSLVTSEQKILSQVEIREYDIILANINRRVLLESAKQLTSFLKEMGVLLISGVLIEDEEIVKESYESAGFKHISTRAKGEWKCIKFIRPSL